jgi:copper resistance protein B
MRLRIVRVVVCVGAYVSMAATFLPGSARAQPANPGDAASTPAVQLPPQAADDQEPPSQEVPPEGQSPEQQAAHAVGQPVTPIPPVTDADRAAAFPDVESHAMQDNTLHYFVLLDQLEWQGSDATSGVSWDSTGWVGGDQNRLWFRTDGGADDGRLGEAAAHVLYGRAVARWWDVVVGVRQDVRPGPARSWLALGVQGLAPYWFEIEATVYLGAGGRTAARLEAQYELLLTNRLVFQPLVEVNLSGKTDIERGIGAGLSSFDAGLRLRYEIRRELAPYVGLTWRDTFGETSRFAEATGEAAGDRRLVAGLRLWF